MRIQIKLRGVDTNHTSLQSITIYARKTLSYGYTTWSNRQFYKKHRSKVYHEIC